MHPTFQLGPLDFPAYFTFLTLGYLLAVMLAWRESFKTTGVDPNKLLDLSIVMLIAGVLGARLLHVVAGAGSGRRGGPCGRGRVGPHHPRHPRHAGGVRH